MARKDEPGGKIDEVADARRRTKPRQKNKGDGWRALLAYDKRGEGLRVVEANLMLIWRNDPDWAGRLAYDERSLRVVWRESCEVCGAAAGDELKESHAAEAVLWLANSHYKLLVKRVMVYDTLVAAAYEKSFDPVRDWLTTLQWDGVERLDRWLADATGCAFDPYTVAVGSKWLISAVARALRPGCKVDTMLILCGPQGSLKSSLLAELGGLWFSDQVGEIGNKDTLLQIHGPWILEMSELDALTKREATSVKAFLTTTTDRFRRPYGHGVETYPRRCVFAGTTNLETFLKDDTGGRRFWPVKIEEIDLEYVKTNRNQLFAEARARFESGENWWIGYDDEAAELAADEQERRRRVDPWEEKIASWLAGHLSTADLTVNDILEGIGIDTARRDHSAATRVGICMTKTNWTRKRKRVHGILTYVYLPPVRAVGDESESRYEPGRNDNTPSQRRFGDEY